MHPIQRLLPHQGVDLATRRHAPHDGQVIARQLRSEDRRPPLGGIGLHRPLQEVESGFVHQNKHSVLASRPLPQIRPDFVPPGLDGFLVALKGPSDWHLRCPVKLLEQAGDLALVISDPEFLLDHLGDTGARPDLAPEPVSLRTMPQELRNQTTLRERESRWVTRSGMGAEGLGAARTRGQASGSRSPRRRRGHRQCHVETSPAVSIAPPETSAIRAS